MQCKSADELMALAKAEGIAITKDEAEPYMAELADFELHGKELKNVAAISFPVGFDEAGGGCYNDCSSNNCNNDWAFDVL